MDNKRECWIFTGSQHGMTFEQYRSFRKLFVTRTPAEFRHGDCVGADATAHNVVITSSTLIPVIYPATVRVKRAWCEPGCNMQPLPPLQRNRVMIDAPASPLIKRVIATPAQDHEVLRSGTWSAIRYAVTQGIWVTIIWPSGEVKVHWERNGNEDSEGVSAAG
jgi:hypothetical protein